IMIGRAPLNHIVIDNPSVSAQHAILARVADTYGLKDLHSTNGTQINGVAITDAKLKDGDKIRFGSVVAIYIAEIVLATSLAARREKSKGKERVTLRTGGK